MKQRTKYQCDENGIIISEYKTDPYVICAEYSEPTGNVDDLWGEGEEAEIEYQAKIWGIAKYMKGDGYLAQFGYFSRNGRHLVYKSYHYPSFGDVRSYLADDIDMLMSGSPEYPG